MNAFFLLLACDVNTPGTTETQDTQPVVTTDLSYHADIAPIVSRSCVGCHNAEGVLGAMDLSSFDKLSAMGPVVEIVTEARTMPPWQASGDCNEYAGDFSLTDDEIATLAEWVQGGMPEGDPAEAATLPDPIEAEPLDRVDLSLQMPEGYTPSGSPDDYRCFLIDWPYEEDVWVTGFEVSPGDLETVHHVIPYIIPEGDVAQYRALDEGDEGTGYRCYGGPGGDVFSLYNMKWLGSWAPGGGANLFPEGTGLRVKPGSVVAFQVHYYVEPGSSPGPDLSGIDLKIETESQGWGNVQPFTDPVWVLKEDDPDGGMIIPAQTDGVTQEWSYALSSSEDFAFRSVAMHMHTLGQSARFEVEHADGSRTCLLDTQNYDFNWQRSYELLKPVNVGEGDTLHLSCTWDNPTDETVAWGDGTDDEMCLAISYITQQVAE